MKRLREHGNAPDPHEREVARMLAAFDDVGDSPIERSRVRARLAASLAQPRRIAGLRPVTLAAVLGIAAAAAAAWMTYQLTRGTASTAPARSPAATQSEPPAATVREPPEPSAPRPLNENRGALPATPPPIEDDDPPAPAPAPARRGRPERREAPPIAEQAQSNAEAVPKAEPVPKAEATPQPPALDADSPDPALEPEPRAAAQASPAPVPAIAAHEPPAQAPPSPAAAASETPAEEARFVSRALRALRIEHNPALASDLLTVYLRRFPIGVLVEEALALAIEAAVARRDPAASALAQRYLKRFPSGRFRLQAERVRHTRPEAR